MCVCVCEWFVAYAPSNYYDIVRQVSKLISHCQYVGYRHSQCLVFKGGGKPYHMTRETPTLLQGIQQASRT